MKNILYVAIGLILCVGCSYNQQIKITDKVDSTYVIGMDSISTDSFLKIKDSLIYSKEDNAWMTKKLHWFWYECPDTIIVAFTRDGVFEDSVEAIRQGLVEDSIGNYYSPAYVFGSVVGDAWVYDINGKFIEFNESPFPHSGKGHKYHP